jgi:hypothetical protein
MINAVTGDSAYVAGNNNVIVVSGPIPGSTPISVPKKHPTNAYIKFCIDNAVENPRIKLLSKSIK